MIIVAELHSATGNDGKCAAHRRLVIGQRELAALLIAARRRIGEQHRAVTANR